MTCFPSVPFYNVWSKFGLLNAQCPSDGYSIQLTYNQAYPITGYSMGGYNIYYSTERENVFSEGPKYANVQSPFNEAWIGNLIPGDTLFFASRAFQYESTWYDPKLLPDAESARPNQSSVIDGYLKYYPETFLTSDISSSQLVIGLADIELFPAYGIIQIGYELVRYGSIDLFDGNVIVSERGFLGTVPTEHTVAGWDGYGDRSPIITFWKGLEEQNGLVFQEEVKFGYPNNSFTLIDGYRVGDNLLTLDRDAVEPEREDFKAYCFSGYHRNSADQIINGECSDSYILKFECCAPGTNGEDDIVTTSNIPITTLIDQNLEMLLENTGEPVILLQRITSGIRCSCYEPNNENGDMRCNFCYGTTWVKGYTQHFYERRSDGRMLARFGPADEEIKLEEAGLESSVQFSVWTLTAPQINERDIIVRFDDKDQQEFRYVVKTVTRNKLFYGQSGKQSFTVQRLRKTDPAYQVRTFDDTAMFPININTNIGILRGPNNEPLPHTHVLRVSEHTILLSDVDQETGNTLNHTHTVNPRSILVGVGSTESSLGHVHTFNV